MAAQSKEFDGRSAALWLLYRMAPFLAGVGGVGLVLLFRWLGWF